jgi:metal-sulfur cluster biosynthetic enzyme
MIATKDEELLEALRSVIDPEIGLNIVELGLIRNLAFDEDEKAKVTMILTTPFCPYGPQLIQQVKLTADSVTGGGSIVEMGTELWDPSMMEEGAGGDWGLF